MWPRGARVSASGLAGEDILMFILGKFPLGEGLEVLHLRARCNQITKARQCLKSGFKESAKNFARAARVSRDQSERERESQKGGDNTLRRAFLGLVYCLHLLFLVGTAHSYPFCQDLRVIFSVSAVGLEQFGDSPQSFQLQSYLLAISILNLEPM